MIAAAPRRRDSWLTDVAGALALYPPTHRPTSYGATSSVPSQAGTTAIRRVAADVAEGGWRVIRSIRIPSAQGLLDFFRHQVLVNTLGWLSGLATVYLVTHLFAVKGFRNLWGLTSTGGRTLVSPDHYRLIMTVTGFTVGLLMMLFVRHFLMRWIAETRAVRAERIGLARVAVEEGSAPVSAPVGLFDDLELDRHP